MFELVGQRNSHEPRYERLHCPQAEHLCSLPLFSGVQNLQGHNFDFTLESLCLAAPQASQSRANSFCSKGQH
ncbi:hypothetical protein ACLOJK_030620 [Asimina triloba]